MRRGRVLVQEQATGFFRRRRRRLFAATLAAAFFSGPLAAQQGAQSGRETMYSRYLEFPSLVRGGSVKPHWLADGSTFWYAEGAPESTVLYKVDPTANTKTPLFDTTRLREALSRLLGHEPPHRGLPFEEFSFVGNREQAVRFSVEHRELVLQLATYALAPAPGDSAEQARRGALTAEEALSPDGRWIVSVKDYNLWLRDVEDGRSIQLTSDGVKGYEWSGVDFAEQWSPDGRRIAATKVDSRHVPQVPLVHYLKPTEPVEWVEGGGAGGPASQTALFVIDVPSGTQIRIDLGDKPGQEVNILGWRPGGSELLVLYMDRTARELDLIAANPANGSTRAVLRETEKTFVMGFEPDRWRTFFTVLAGGDRFLWLSERDGWNHLYLYDMGGQLIRRLTRGAFPIERVIAVDEAAGWVYFTAHGDRDRPYDTHLYRVNLRAGDMTRLTEAPGEHRIRFAPSKKFFLDTHSTVQEPPTVELRRADGRLLQTLTVANAEALRELRWSPPEPFTVKAADGRTDLYGVLYKPFDFDPQKKYPVIDIIYGGPQFSEVPHSFTHPHGLDYHAEHGQALAQLGFVTFVVDARGTPGRGKAFQDLVYGQVGRYEIPDHVAALKQLAAERSYMDLSRVGILGKSFGAYFALRAMLLAPEVYHVGIAVSGAPDLDLAGMERYMGLPGDNPEGYAYASSVRLAGKLQGKLMFIHGTSDANDSFARILKMVGALVEAGKPFDLLVLPEQAHHFDEATTRYVREGIRRYFEQYLHR